MFVERRVCHGLAWDCLWDSRSRALRVEGLKNCFDVFGLFTVLNLLQHLSNLFTVDFRVVLNVLWRDHDLSVITLDLSFIVSIEVYNLRQLSSSGVVVLLQFLV